MKIIRTAALVICAVMMFSILCSCGASNKMTDSSLIDILDNELLGKNQEDIMALDTFSKAPHVKVKEKEMEDGTHRVKYVYVEEGAHGDAFVSGGKWFTTVNYFFDEDSLVNYQIEYRQSDYSEGMCAKRMTMFAEYLTEKYGEPVEDNVWSIAGGNFKMARQNGGWILFTYKAAE